MIATELAKILTIIGYKKRSTVDVPRARTGGRNGNGEPARSYAVSIEETSLDAGVANLRYRSTANGRVDANQP